MELKMSIGRLDDKVGGECVLHGEVFAYVADSDLGNPAYTIFVDTTEYDKLWRETTSGFNPRSDWGELLRKKYEENPGLKERLSDERKYGVPGELLDTPHQEGGGHGDVRLRYRKANVVFMPMSDYNGFFRNDPEFLGACEILYESGKFIKGGNDLLRMLGIEIKESL
ncbi:hypothetical protein COV19_04260 [Candidatus Woesearchaeota archaeon CG10_big_fil_rev_8_21_14_0_10_44_13]|nr:MAG: hypothetical protein COV19_04260 [Candidatus Woesearchaeota archaeon CG10_big_fil_rev_8_21_14_0_10_44_13]